MSGLDLGEPVQTRDGRTVRILCTNANALQPVIGLVKESVSDREVARHWFLDGHFDLGGRDHPCDLVNVPKPPERRKLFLVQGALTLDSPHGSLWVQSAETLGFLRAGCTLLGSVWLVEGEWADANDNPQR
jgi:hypothetical protein